MPMYATQLASKSGRVRLVGVLSIIFFINLKRLIDFTAICGGGVDLFQLVRTQYLSIMRIVCIALRKFFYIEVVVVLRGGGRLGWRRLPDSDRVWRIERRMSGINGSKRR